MPNMPRHARQQHAERANAQFAPVREDIIERGNAVDVDQTGGTREPKIHRRDETLPASEDLSILAVRGEEIQGLVNCARRKISKRDGFHPRQAIEQYSSCSR